MDPNPLCPARPIPSHQWWEILILQSECVPFPILQCISQKTNSPNKTVLKPENKKKKKQVNTLIIELFKHNVLSNCILVCSTDLQ